MRSKALGAVMGAGLLLAAAGCGSASSQASTSSPASASSSTASSTFYKGKTVKLIVPNAPGGTMDVYARMIAPYLAKYLGAAQIQVDDMQGAAGVVGLNALWASSKNGYTIGFTNADVPILTSVLKSPGVKYKGAQFTYLGNVASQPRVLVVGAKSGITNAKQLQQLKAPFKYASSGFDDDFYIMMAMSQTLHFPLKVITGYSSQAQTIQAVTSGTTAGETAALTPVQGEIKTGAMKPILMVSNSPISGYSQVPLWKNEVSGSNKSMAKDLGDIVLMTRSLMGPPGMNPTAVKLVRAALAKAMKDPGLLARAKKAHFPLTFMPGSQEQTTIVSDTQDFQQYAPSLIKATAALKK